MESDWIDLLLSDEGRELLDYFTAHPPGPANELAVQARLRERHSRRLVTAVMAQAALRVRAREKFANADHMLFTPHGLEQASSDRMTGHHDRRFEGFTRMADLCCGIGGDLAGLARDRFVIAVDMDPVHARLARLNARANGAGDNVLAVRADVRALPLAGLDAAFIDPARRSGDRRYGRGGSDPPLEWCFDLAGRIPVIAIKASPALATEIVPEGWVIEFVSERRELKESLLLSPALAVRGAPPPGVCATPQNQNRAGPALTSSAHRRATLLPGGHTLEDAGAVGISVKLPGRYLLDPDPAVTRAGLVAELATAVGDCWKIDERIAFLSADRAIRTPFARTLEIVASMPWNLKQLRKELRSRGIGTVDIRKRGSAVDVADIGRRLKLEGEAAATVVLTRVNDAPWMLICSELTDG